MNAEEFWKDDPQLFASYRISFINKKKKEAEEEDYKCWLQGLYIHDGNGTLVAALEQFLSGSKNKQKIERYPEKPYTVLEKERNSKNELETKRKKEKYKNFQNSLMYFGTLKERYKEKLKKGE